MKLQNLPGVLFDEFPTDETVRYCFLTQPKYPSIDCRQYSDNVVYCASEATLLVMSSFKKLSIKQYYVVTERRRLFTYGDSQTFSIRAPSTGSRGANPVMFLIEIDDEIHLYTGQFTQCRDLLLNQMILHYFDRVDDIHVDNTTAALREPHLLKKACAQIKQIVSDFEGYTIVLEIDLFGYEDLLYELARNQIKIQLSIVQRAVFECGGMVDVFDYDGDPQIKIWARFSSIEESKIPQRHYQKLFEKEKKLHIKPIVCQHEIHCREKIKGLILIPYTPHANAYELYSLFQSVKPKRIHPLIQQSYADDQLSAIPMDLLNGDCQIVDVDNFLDDSFLYTSQDVSLSDLSGDISGPIIDDESFSSDDSSYENATKDTESNRQTKQADNSIIEIISDDDDDDDDNDRYNMDFKFDSHDQNESNPEPKVAKSNEQATNSKDIEPKGSFECHGQQQQQKQQPNIFSSPAYEQQPSATAPSPSPPPNTKTTTQSVQPIVGSRKRRAMKIFQPVQRNQQIQYMPSSDDELEDVHQNKRFRSN